MTVNLKKQQLCMTILVGFKSGQEHLIKDQIRYQDSMSSYMTYLSNGLFSQFLDVIPGKEETDSDDNLD